MEQERTLGLFILIERGPALRWIGRLVGAKVAGVAVMIAATESIMLTGGDDRWALYFGGLAFGIALCKLRVI